MADSDFAPLSPPTSSARPTKSRDQLIYEYTQAERERIKNQRRGINRSTPPGHTDRPRPRHPLQWPLQQQPLVDRPTPQGRTQAQLASYRDRAPQQPHNQRYDGHVRPRRPIDYKDYYRHRPRGGPAQMTPPNRPGPRGPPPGRMPLSEGRAPIHPSQRPPYLERSPPSQRPQPSQRTPSLQSRYSTRSSSQSSWGHRPPFNAHSPVMPTSSSPERPSPTAQQPQQIPRWLGVLPASQDPSVPVIAEEHENRQSPQSSPSSFGGSDVLSEYYRSDSARNEEVHSQAGSGYPTQHAVREESPSHPEQQASGGQQQRSMGTFIQSAPGSSNEDHGSYATSETPPSELTGVKAGSAQLPTPTITMDQSFLSDPSNTPSVQEPPPASEPQSFTQQGLGIRQPGQSFYTATTSRESLTSLQSPTPGNSVPSSPRPRSKSPLKLIESRFRQKPAEAEDVLEAPRAYFASGPSTSSVNLVADNKPSPGLLGVEAPTDARLSRASMTSLPGLLSRALRMASNLERGKTSSKFGIDWMTSANANTEQTMNEKHRSEGSFNNMMDAFPTTPGSPGTDQMFPPSGLRQSQHIDSLPEKADDGQKGRRRQCCFMPLWLFITLVIIVTLVVIAAVIIPVALIVIPRQHDHSTRDVAIDPSCTRTTLVLPPVNVGSGIPRLIKLSQAKFDITLDATTLFDVFKNGDSSCAAQNALVTFAGLSARSLVARQDAPAATSFGIIYAPSATSVFGLKTIASSTGAATPTMTTTGTVSTASAEPLSSQTIDYARLSVLFVLQQTSDMDLAMKAQKRLQQHLSMPTGASRSVDLGAGWTVDLIDLSLTSA